MAINTYPKPTAAGSLNIAEWQRMSLAQNVDGVTSGFTVTNPSALTIRVASGYAKVGGFAAYQDASSDLAVSSQVSGTRTDRVVLRLTWTGSSTAPSSVTIVPAISAGSSGTPTIAPSPVTNAAGTWEISLATYQVTGTTMSNLVPTVWQYPAVSYFDLTRFSIPPTGDEEPGFGWRMSFTANGAFGFSTPAGPSFTTTDSGGTLNFAAAGWYDFKGVLNLPENITSLSAVTVITRPTPSSSWATAYKAYVSTGPIFNFNASTVFYQPAGGQLQVLISKTSASTTTVTGRCTLTLLRA